MCRAKPGPRCPSCQTKALTAAESHLARILERRDNAPDTSPRRAELEGKAREVAREIASRRSDLYSTRQYQKESERALARMIDTNPDDPDVRALAATIAEGRLMSRYRREQAALMPPKPALSAARAAHQQLGDARFDMAHARIRMDMSATSPTEWQHWQQEHLHAAQRAALAAAELRAITDSGRADGWVSMTADQQRELRDTISCDGSFDTPVAPRKYRDVLAETQDIVDGIVPVREAVDDASIAPFGDDTIRTDDTAWREGDDARPTASDSDSDDVDSDDDSGGDAERGRASQRGRPTTRGASLRRQASRRAKRRTQVGAQWRQMRAGARRLEQSEQRSDQLADSVVGDYKDTESMFDLTLLSYIAEQIGNKR
ncbi:hypothetical protein [Gordonia otitidis]|nr:hypothetical protein [Gordonia otitidis]